MVDGRVRSWRTHTSSSTDKSFPNGSWRPITGDGTTLFNLGTVPVTRYTYRATRSPSLGKQLSNPTQTAETVESPLR